MNVDSHFGPVKIKDENGHEVCYRRIGGGIWLAMDAERYVWSENVEVPDSVLELAQEYDDTTVQEWAIWIW
ncbi:hypothetical protein [Methylococcus sp. EFPC2]|uniref:hypothetical protein n=1 Tax=Methylococcus sp. EFPC2 TaxID=2812648 RepID=UPI001968402C|nr:hypothetical protein [Methylococcus sp. EFPC2]QSA97920.1 hypothetical protein JWZ97_03570 [Methylococcus sp. EFPC2]